MSLIRNESTREITCPQGDTGTLLFYITDGNGNPLSTPLVNSVALFAVCKANGGDPRTGYVAKYSMFTEVIRVEDDETGVEYDAAAFLLDHPFTCVMQPGAYHYDVRLLIGVTYTQPDADGNGGGEIVWEDPALEVHSLYALEPVLPSFIVKGVGKNV